MDFRWNEWTIDHIGQHGVTPEEAELAVMTATKPFPRRIDDKWLVWGRGSGGRFLQVIFVIHARPLTDREKRRFRRRKR